MLEGVSSMARELVMFSLFFPQETTRQQADIRSMGNSDFFMALLKKSFWGWFNEQYHSISGYTIAKVFDIINTLSYALQTGGSYGKGKGLFHGFSDNA